MGVGIHHLNSRLIISHADSSYNKNGEQIPEGKKQTRIELSYDKRIYIATWNYFTGNNWLSNLVRRIVEFVAGRSYVTVKISETESALTSLKSLSHRLHLTPDEILTEAKKGLLEKLILERRASVLGKFDTTKWLIKTKTNYTVEENLLKASYGESHPIQDVENTFSKIFQSCNREKWENVEVVPKEVQPSYEQIIFAKVKRKKFELLVETAEEPIAGGTSWVYTAHNITRGTMNVLKKAKPGFEETIEAEARLTRILNPNNDVPGLTEKATTIFKNGSVACYPLYDSDMLKFINDEYWDQFPMEDQLSMVFQLICGFYYLNELGYCQADYKLDNVVIDQKNKKLRLIDFGGLFKLNDKFAADRHDLNPAKKKNGDQDILYSSTTFPYSDLSKMRPMIANTDDGAFREGLKKVAVFAFAATLCDILVGLPYQLTQLKFPNLAELDFSEFYEKNIPTPIIELLESMAAEEPTQRPAIEDIPELYITALREWNNELMNARLSEIEAMFQFTKDKVTQWKEKNSSPEAP